MKRLILILIGTSLLTLANAQTKYYTRDGHIDFYSEAPVENIEANNNSVICVLDEETGALEFAVLMKSFEFDKPLMEEHFNENYVESHKFPKAKFKGKVHDFSVEKVESAPTEFTVSGTLEIHGVSREIEVTGTIFKKADRYHMDSKFMVKPEDYDIDIPNTVRDNIAKEIEVTVKMNLEELSK